MRPHLLFSLVKWYRCFSPNFIFYPLRYNRVTVVYMRLEIVPSITFDVESGSPFSILMLSNRLGVSRT